MNAHHQANEPININTYGERLQATLYGMSHCDPNELGLGFAFPCKVWTPERVAALERLLGITTSRHSVQQKG